MAPALTTWVRGVPEARVDGGETGWEDHYMRRCPEFDVGAESHGRLTRNLFVAGDG